MKLLDLYIPYERQVVEELFNKLIKSFRDTGRAPYLDKYGNPKEDEFMQLERISTPTETIYFKRRNNNPIEWEVPFSKLKNAIKVTIRFGRILRPTDYLIMDGKSNFIGTPLHLLVSLLSEEEYKKYGLANCNLVHQKFGKVKILEIDYPENNVVIEYEPENKIIKMDYWEIDEKEFKEALRESRA